MEQWRNGTIEAMEAIEVNMNKENLKCKRLQLWWLKDHPKLTGVCGRCDFNYDLSLTDTLGDRREEGNKNNWECPKCGVEYPNQLGV